MKHLIQGLLHRYTVLDFSWGALQSLLGLLLSLASLIAGARLNSVKGHCCIVQDSPLLPRNAGISLGPFLVGGDGFYSWKHEYGHTFQSRLLEPLYLVVIGIPSVLSAALRPAKHHKLFAERWADAWSPRHDLALRFDEASQKTRLSNR